MKAYKMNIDFGRMGELSSFFIATPEIVNGLIGKRFYSSDILGKHSEVNIKWDKEDFDDTLEEMNFSENTVKELYDAFHYERGMEGYALISGTDFVAETYEQASYEEDEDE